MSTPRIIFLAVTVALTIASGHARERAPHARLDLLAQGSVEVGHVSYEQIAQTIYGERLGEIIETKQAWRMVHPDQPWLSDYELLLKVAVNVEVAPTAHEQRTSDGVLARFTLETNTAHLPRASSGSMLAHEVGHGLTRRTVRTAEQRAEVDHRLKLTAKPPQSALARESGFDLDWLTYVATQVEFEVRLQALNRYHFEMTGRVIDSPAEALRAVASLGTPLQHEEIANALASADCTDAPNASIIASARRNVWSSVPECFRNADDLRRALQMAAVWDPSIRRTLLTKIALEAPGHF